MPEDTTIDLENDPMIKMLIGWLEEELGIDE